MRHNPPEFDDEDGICRQQDAQSTSQQEQKYLQEATTSKMCERVFPRGHDRRGQKGHNHHELDAHTDQTHNTHQEAQRTRQWRHVQVAAQVLKEGLRRTVPEEAGAKQHQAKKL